MNVRKQWRQWKTKDMMKGMAAVLICTGVLCISAFAEGASGPTSNVWLDVIPVPTAARISVTVPLSYGFAVIGSAEESAGIPVSTINGNILLPKTVSQSSVPIRNYSTDVRDEYAEEAFLPREGLPVEVRPYMTWDDRYSARVHHWEPSLTDPTWDGVSAEKDAKVNFKKFQMLLNDLPFSKKGQQNVIWLKDESAIALDAPPNVLDYGCTPAGTAQIPSEQYISVQVRVGGMQNQYKQAEQSLKVGTIYWDVIPGELPAVTES